MAAEQAISRWWQAWREAEAGGTASAAPLPRRAPSARRRLPLGGLIGLGLVLLLVLVAAVGPFALDVDPGQQALLERLRPPVGAGGGSAHPLGTDALGRDILARIVVGARVSLLVGVLATLVAGAIGVALGLVGGYGGGVTDALVTFATDVQLAIPFVVVAIAVAATLGAGLLKVVLVLALTGWVGYARIVRLQARALRRAPWVEAARAVGVGRGRLLARHVLPSLIGPIVVVASQQVAAMILYEAALSYLGLGVPAEVVTWGKMVADGRDALLTAWWVSTIPGIAIAVAILGFNLLGDGLRDALDPAWQRK